MAGVNAPPEVSIVIPIYNEEGLLHASVVDLHERLRPLDLRYELLLVENGSSDNTAGIARDLCHKYPEVRLIRTSTPNYGKALRSGIQAAKGTWIICDEIDLCDTDFYSQALKLLRNGEADMVIGSKLIGGARDARPLFRHAASHAYTSLLRLLFGFPGTDTHGLKAFHRLALAEVLQACIVDKDVFASEFVLRAYRSKVRVREIPVQLVEKRPPSIHLLRRVPAVIKSLAKLTWAIRVKS
ncbi:MAG: glycosyltransferase family 2 protein [Polyangiaceae bacterium]|nr:glycosyltransferase family 2 protein [Polyangiaceae bacterium]